MALVFPSSPTLDQIFDTGLGVRYRWDGSKWVAERLTTIEEVSYSKVVATHTLAPNEGIVADTSAGVFTVTLPPTPLEGTMVAIADGGDWSVNNLTVARNGSTIEGLEEDLVLSSGGVLVDFIYDGSTWQVYLPSASTSEEPPPSGSGEPDIGIAGAQGFGVGVYEGTLPLNLTDILDNQSPASATYGNYQYSDGSVCVFVPKFYYRIGDVNSPNYADYGDNAIDIASANDYADEATANAAGYALPRAFKDGGQVKSGFFFDKYVNSPEGTTHGKSVQDGVPISLTTSATYTNSASMDNCVGQLHDAITLSKARGSIWQCASIFQYSALALLSLAHAQASTSNTYCAWYDSAGTANFPKGCNNNALGDVDDGTLTFTTAGDSGNANKPLAGSANNFAKTTHNGQDCGISDLNGTMWETALGVTIHGTSSTDNAQASNSDLWTLKETVSIRDLTSGWNSATDAWQNSTNITTLYDYVPNGMWWANTAGAYVYFGNGTNQVLDPAISGLGYLRTNILMPKDAAATSATGINLYGNDGIYQYARSNLFVQVGGYWASSSAAGVFASAWFNFRSNDGALSGFRASAYGQ